MPASPAMTFNTAGNLLNVASLAAGASTSPVTILADGKFDERLQIAVTFGTVTPPAGLRVSVYPIVAGGTTPDTVEGPGSFTIAAATGTTRQSVWLQTGRYSVVLTNLDGSNPVTSVTITSATTDSVG